MKKVLLITNLILLAIVAFLCYTLSRNEEQKEQQSEQIEVLQTEMEKYRDDASNFMNDLCIISLWTDNSNNISDEQTMDADSLILKIHDFVSEEIENSINDSLKDENLDEL